MNRLENYERNLNNYRNNEPSRIVLDPRLPRETNRILVDDLCNYLNMDSTWVSIVEYVCTTCKNIITNKPHPRKLDLFCFQCGKAFP